MGFSAAEAIWWVRRRDQAVQSRYGAPDLLGIA